MHAVQREKLILELLAKTGIVSYRELETKLGVSGATVRLDLMRLEGRKLAVRARGDVMLPEIAQDIDRAQPGGAPSSRLVAHRLIAKRVIAKAAASLCETGEVIMLGAGMTTLQMCPFFKGLGLQVVTNSLHIVEALLPQPDTHILLPSGTVSRDRNIILAPSCGHSMPRFHAPKLFMGAVAVGPQGVMQQDAILVAAERRFIDQADQVILLADSSKFVSSSGPIVCGLDEVDVLVTDAGVGQEARAMLAAAGVRLIVAA